MPFNIMVLSTIAGHEERPLLAAVDPKQPLAGQGRTTGIRRKVVNSRHGYSYSCKKMANTEKSSNRCYKARPDPQIDTQIPSLPGTYQAKRSAVTSAPFFAADNQ